MSICDTGLFAGMTTQQLQTALAGAQQAYIAIASGAQGESYAYTQGDGSKSVTYTRANLDQLRALISMLQSALGLNRGARRPIRPVWR